MTNHGADVTVRRLEHGDLSAALAIQAENYPAFLIETEQAFASRLDVAAPYCLAAVLDGALAGYLLAHGWPRHSPPPVGTVLPREAPSEVLYVHDLGVSAPGRGLGIGRRLMAQAFDMACGDGLAAAELIAVEGAASYWRTLGFAEAPASPALSRKLAGYGSDARWMTRPLASGAPTPVL